MFIIITTMAAPVEEHAKHPHSPYLFVSPKTGTMFDPDSFRHTHEKILKAIGAEHIRFHDLRHTYAAEKYTSLVDGGMTPLDAHFSVSRLLGHERPDVTNIYLASVKGGTARGE